jgi:hypothetical protein
MTADHGVRLIAIVAEDRASDIGHRHVYWEDAFVAFDRS